MNKIPVNNTTKTNMDLHREKSLDNSSSNSDSSLNSDSDSSSSSLSEDLDDSDSTSSSSSEDLDENSSSSSEDSSSSSEDSGSSNEEEENLDLDLDLEQELEEKETANLATNSKNILYPNLNDKNFNIKIASKEEFNNTKYDGTIHKNIQEQADYLIFKPYELQPHQTFVKNFLSLNTPYNGLLLFHGLGTGKTCSGIGIAEEMREFMQQNGVVKRIIVVASDNVQQNFRNELFDEHKLVNVNGFWELSGCTGSNLLKIANPGNMKNIPKNKIIAQIKNYIDKYYHFMGYIQFANYIKKHIGSLPNNNKNKKKNFMKFNNRLIIIDEIHTIRDASNKNNKMVAMYLNELVENAHNMRLVLLSATPMYNSFKEIVWLLNLLNKNDKRSTMDRIFNDNGEFTSPESRELFLRKATGYVSFVRGENPYTFPFRIYPSEFAPNHTFKTIKYPTHTFHGNPLANYHSILNLYLDKLYVCSTHCKNCQYCYYNYIVNGVWGDKTSKSKENLVKENLEEENLEDNVEEDNLEEDNLEEDNSEDLEEEKDVDEESPEAFSENNLQIAVQSLYIQSLIICYPSHQASISKKLLTGKKGLNRIVDTILDTNNQLQYAYKTRGDGVLPFGRIFTYDLIGKYSIKIKNVLDSIYNPTTKQICDGIVLIYSEYLSGGLVPMALALEEMGMNCYGKPNLLQKPVTSVAATSTTSATSTALHGLSYCMITGPDTFSPNKIETIEALRNDKNVLGEKIKVVLISRAGSEGVDLKFIRQIHILGPWFNMNRLEQIIGRGVRHFSHKLLPFEKRNVEIFLHAAILCASNTDNKKDNKNNKKNANAINVDVETVDLYVYRNAETKAMQIGKIARILKETAVDCILNQGQTNFTQEKINSSVEQQLSNGTIIQLKPGDLPHTFACDYMATCDYTCKPNLKSKDISYDTFRPVYMQNNYNKISIRILDLMKEGYFYKKRLFVEAIRIPVNYPYIQIYYVISQFIDKKNNLLVYDKYNRAGNLIEMSDYYLFQPLELKDPHIPIWERSRPIDKKAQLIQPVIYNFRKNANAISKDLDLDLDSDLDLDLVTDSKIKKNNKNVEILNQISTSFQQGLTDTADTNTTWYTMFAQQSTLLKAKLSRFTNDIVKEILMQHIVDTMMYAEKKVLLEYIYQNREKGNTEIEETIYQYFEQTKHQVDKLSFMLLYDVSKMDLLCFDNGNKWLPATPVQKKKFITYMNAKMKEKMSNMNDIVGLIDLNKNHNELVFKTKDFKDTRSTGSKCAELSKPKIEKIVGENLLDVNMDGATSKKIMENTKVKLCVMEEMLVRYLNLGVTKVYYMSFEEIAYSREFSSKW